MNTDWKKILAVVIGLVLLAGVAYLVLWLKPEAKTSEVEVQNGSSTLGGGVGEGGRSIKYRNDKYGFEIDLPSGYDGYTTTEESGIDFLGGFTKYSVVSFWVDASGTLWPTNKFDVFIVSIYDVSWWDKEVVLRSGTNSAFLRGDEDGLSLGDYVGRNSKYVFAISRGQDCPGSKTDPSNYGSNTSQCKLFSEVLRLASVFKFFEPATGKVIVDYTKPRGARIGYIKKVYENNGGIYIDFDEVKFFYGDAAIKFLEENGGCTPDEGGGCFLPDNYIISNKDEVVQSLLVKEDAKVTVLGNGYDLVEPNGISITPEEFKNNFGLKIDLSKIQPSTFYVPENPPYWINQNESGAVTSVAEQYIP